MTVKRQPDTQQPETDGHSSERIDNADKDGAVMPEFYFAIKATNEKNQQNQT